ncbi:MAG: SUMF1/EgtB/PvdO family nonheme iron enzyme [Verrucomicrobiota bacterium]
MIALLLDENGDDRTKLADSILDNFDCTLYTADSNDDALKNAKGLEKLHLFIASIPSGDVDGVLETRTKIEEKFPKAIAVFISKGDLSKHYDKLKKHEGVFYKPSDEKPLFDWIKKLFPGASKSEGKAADDRPAPTAASELDQAPKAPPSQAMEKTPAKTQGAPLAVGASIGDYEVLEYMGRGSKSDGFIALQKSVDRRVGLRLLRTDVSDADTAKERFLSEAKAQAAVQHKHIASVFELHEGSEEESRVYFAQELIEGRALESYGRHGDHLREEKLLQLLKDAAEAYKYLYDQELSFQRISADHIYITEDGSTRIANTVEVDPNARRLTQSEQILRLAEVTSPLMDKETKENETLPTLFGEMSDPNGDDGIETWDDLLAEIKYIERQWKEMSGELTPRKAAIYMVFTVATIVGVIAIGIGLFYFFKIMMRPEVRDLAQMIRIPAGEFVYQNDEKIQLEQFWIDKYEVTIGQYAEFIDYLAENPGDAKKYDHPDQPDYKKSHEPVGWASMYRSARDGKDWKFKDAEDQTIRLPIDLNYPVMLVDWWDAYAYARWKGRRLPTEQEWEAAGRGPRGLKYPWGNEFRWANVNAGNEYPPNVAAKKAEALSETPTEAETPAMQDGDPNMASGAPNMASGDPNMASGGGQPAGGDAAADGGDAAEGNDVTPTEPPAPTVEDSFDGFEYFTAVDQIEGDRSADYNVYGLAGNVTEWTGSWDAHPGDPNRQTPVLRGASFQSLDRIELYNRRFFDDAMAKELFIGFRTATSADPALGPDPSLTTPAPAADGDAPAEPSTEEDGGAPAPSGNPFDSGGDAPAPPADNPFDSNGSTPAPTDGGSTPMPADNPFESGGSTPAPPADNPFESSGSTPEPAENPLEGN